MQLEAEWTENRKPCLQPLPRDLAHRLYESAQSGEPSRLYAKFHKRKHHTATIPKQPLLYVPSHTARSVDQDLKSAGIPKQGPGGKIDFHAIRKAYINLVIESGVHRQRSPSPSPTRFPRADMNVYGHAREDRLADAFERVAEAVLPVQRLPVEYQQAVGAETEIATHIEIESCDNKRWWRRRKSNPKATFSDTRSSDTEAEQTHIQSVMDSDQICADQNPDTSVHIPSTSLHLKRVPEEL